MFLKKKILIFIGSVTFFLGIPNQHLNALCLRFRYTRARYLTERFSRGHLNLILFVALVPIIMRINNLTGTAFAASVVTAAGDSGACTNEVELISPSAPLAGLVKCAAGLDLTGATHAQYIALYKGCVTSLANKVGASFPAVTADGETDCRSCYTAFAVTVTNALSGTVNVDDELTAGTEVDGCKTLATASEKDECFKNSEIIQAMIAFQNCSGHSIVYPAGASLAREREIYRDGAFVSLTQAALGGASLDSADILSDVIEHNSVTGATMQTGGDFYLDLCLLAYHTELSDYMAGEPSQDVLDVCTTIDDTTTDCADTIPVAEALSNFANCAGYSLTDLTSACTTDQADAMWQSDAYANIVNCIFNDDENEPSANCADHRSLLNADIISAVGDDCGACYTEFGTDMEASFDLGTTYGSGCSNPHSSDCFIRTGLSAVSNFKECSGQALNRSAPVAVTTTASPATTTSTTTEAAVTEATTTAASTTKSSSMTAPLATMMLLAIGSALIL